jgi:hypothetical protein
MVLPAPPEPQRLDPLVSVGSAGRPLDRGPGWDLVLDAAAAAGIAIVI